MTSLSRRALREAIADLADRFDMAAKRMSAMTGHDRLDDNRRGQVEAYANAARNVRDVLSLIEGAERQEDQALTDLSRSTLRPDEVPLDPRGVRNETALSSLTATADPLVSIRQALSVASDANLETILNVISAIRFEVTGPPPRDPGLRLCSSCFLHEHWNCVRQSIPAVHCECPVCWPASSSSLPEARQAEDQERTDLSRGAHRPDEPRQDPGGARNETVPTLVERLRIHAHSNQKFECVPPTLCLMCGVAAELERLTAALTVSQEAGWQPIATAPKDEEVFFWVVPLTADEAYSDTSERSIFSPHAPRLHRGKLGTWSSLEKATHWRPLFAPPSSVASAPKDTGEHLAPNGKPIDGYPRQQA